MGPETNTAELVRHTNRKSKVGMCCSLTRVSHCRILAITSVHAAPSYAVQEPHQC